MPQRRGNARVMLVEDQMALRDTLEEGLIGAGYEVIAVSDPTMALALVEKGDLELDVLVTDIRMPKVGGRELAVQIGALRPEMRVLYISGYEGDSESSADRAATLSPMLRKPFSIDELARAIEELLRGDLAD